MLLSFSPCFGSRTTFSRPSDNAGVGQAPHPVADLNPGAVECSATQAFCPLELAALANAPAAAKGARVSGRNECLRSSTVWETDMVEDIAPACQQMETRSTPDSPA